MVLMRSLVMRSKVCFLLFSSLGLPLCPAVFGQEKASDSHPAFQVRSTSIVRRGESGPRQIALVELETSGLKNLTCSIGLAPPEIPLLVHWENVQAGNQTLPFQIPVLKQNQTVQVVLESDGKRIWENAVELTPPKKWRVYDVQVSHHDLGYADYYHLMSRDVREWGIELALEYCRKTDSWPKESRFHWTVETSEPMTGFLQSRPESTISELTRRIKEGRIELGGVHNSVLTEHLSYEVFARLFYTPGRYIRDWMKIPPSKTALISDVVGFSRSLPLYAKEAEIPYFMFGYNESVHAFDQAGKDAVFRWQAQDGDTRMPLCKAWPYYSPDRLQRYTVDEIAPILGRYEAGDAYPYTCLLAEDSFDFGLPDMANVEGIKKWNEEYENPVLVSGTFTMFFEDISSQESKKRFNLFAKDVPDAWADEDLTDARLAGEARLLGYRIPTVEKFATIASVTGGGEYPWTDIYQAYNRLLMYHEHTNGAYSEGPISLPLSLKDSTAANANYYEVEQTMHRALVSEGEKFCRQAEEWALRRLESLMTTKSGSTGVVYNPLNTARSDIVWCELPSHRGGVRLRDNETGAIVPYQRWPDGKISFLATDVPACGYKTYAVLSDGASGESDARQVSGDSVLESRFYRVVFDRATGGIRSIVDKELKVELVDQAAAYKFNEYLYQRFETSSYQDGLKSYHPEKVELRPWRGDVASMMVSTVKAVGCESIVQKVILYHDMKRIDVTVEIDKSTSGRLLRDYKMGTAQSKEALFYALPLNVPNCSITHELSGAVVEPIRDQSDGSATDYYAIQHFTDLSNARYGVTVATREPNLVEYGRPRPAIWDRMDGYEHIMKKSDNSHVYLYLLNNMFFTNICVTQPGPKSFSWAIRSHEGNWKRGEAYRFGWEFSHPLEMRVITGKQTGVLPAGSHSFLDVDKGNVACTTIKPAEANGEGYVLRFFELVGDTTSVTATVRLFPKIARAVETNLIEDDRDVPIRTSESNRIHFSIAPHGVKTIRIIPAPGEIPLIADLKCDPLSDRRIRLSWKTRGKSAGNRGSFRIYRGSSPEFEADARHLVGSTEKQKYLDAPALNYGGWISNTLEPGTTYYYRVCPVGKDNRPGAVSPAVGATTLSRPVPHSGPNKVEGLYVSHVSRITSHNYLCLVFYTNVEKDVGEYLIHRSTNPGFSPDAANLIGKVDATTSVTHVTPHGFGRVERKLMEYNRQMYADESVELNATYYYRVCAVDERGRSGDYSDEAHGTTSVSLLSINGERAFWKNTTIEIGPTFRDGSEIRYTLDGSLPTKGSLLYERPFVLTESVKIAAGLFVKGSSKPEAVTCADFGKAKYPAPRYRTPFSTKWAATGSLALVDGIRGRAYNDDCWQGFEQEDMDVVLDLGEEQEISRIRVGLMQNLGVWIFLPTFVEFEISRDGKQFEGVGREVTGSKYEHTPEVVREYGVQFDRRRVRFVRVLAKSVGICPVWHIGAGGKAWVFADEILVD